MRWTPWNISKDNGTVAQIVRTNIVAANIIRKQWCGVQSINQSINDSIILACARSLVATPLTSDLPDVPPSCVVWCYSPAKSVPCVSIYMLSIYFAAYQCRLCIPISEMSCSCSREAMRPSFSLFLLLFWASFFRPWRGGTPGGSVVLSPCHIRSCSMGCRPCQIGGGRYSAHSVRSGVGRGLCMLFYYWGCRSTFARLCSTLPPRCEWCGVGRVCLDNNGWLNLSVTIVSMNGWYFLISLYSILICIVFGISLELISLLFPFNFQSEEVKILSQPIFICPQVTRWSIWVGGDQPVPPGTNISACLIWYQKTIFHRVYIVQKMEQAIWMFHSFRSKVSRHLLLYWTLRFNVHSSAFFTPTLNIPPSCSSISAQNVML